MKNNEKAPSSPTASHMLWFFIIPAFVFLAWASYKLVGGIAQKTPASSIVEKARAIGAGRSDGDRWKAAYALAEELLKRAKDGQYQALAASDKKEVLESLSTLLDNFKNDQRLKKYLILTLGRLYDPAAIPLLQKYSNDADDDVRFYSRWGYLQTLTKNPAIVSEDDRKNIRAWLHEDNVEFRKIGATFLVQQDAASVEAVLPLLKDKDREVRWNAAVALASVGRKEGAAILKEIFDIQNLRDFGFRSSKDMEALLRAAKEASLKLNDPGVVSLQKKLLADATGDTPESRAIRAALE